MAVGDLVNNVVNIAAGARLIFQPAVNTEYLIYLVGSNGVIGANPNVTPDVSVELFNGAIISIVALGNNDSEFFRNLNLLINNTIYMRILNNNVLAQNISYTGIQIK